MKNNKKNLSFNELLNEMEQVDTTSMVKIKGGTSGGGGVSTIDDGYSYITDANGTYMVDNSSYTSVSGDSYIRVSFDGGQTWENQASSDIASVDVSQINQNLGNYASLAALGAYASNNMAAASAFSNLSTATQGIGIGLDAAQMYNYYNENEGNMDGIRFSIRTSGTAASIIATSAYGGPEGIIVGTVVGGLAQGGEFAYDVTTETLNEVWGQFMNNYSNGWTPSH